MGNSIRAQLLPEAARPKIPDAQLRDSLRFTGQTEAIILHRGTVIDGRRRLEILEQLGRAPRTYEIDDPIEAARYLYQIHPRRAFELFAPQRGKTRPEHLAFMFGVPVEQIPTAKAWMNANVRRRQYKRAPRMKVFGGLEVNRDVYELARDKTRAQGLSLAVMVRWFLAELAGVKRPDPRTLTKTERAELVRSGKL